MGTKVVSVTKTFFVTQRLKIKKVSCFPLDSIKAFDIIGVSGRVTPTPLTTCHSWVTLMAKGKNMAKKNAAGNEGGTATAEAPKGARKNLAMETIPVVSTLNIDPDKIRIVPEFQGRRKPVGESEVADLADNIRTQGQLQPVRVRQVQGTDEYECIFGNTRVRAGQMIKHGYPMSDGKNTVAAAPDFKLRAEVIEISDEDAFSANVSENAARFQTNPIDDAYNQKRLREEMGMSDVAIAKLYGQAHSGMVNRLKKLIDSETGLSEDLQNKVAEGSLGIYAALDLLEVDKDDRDKVYLRAVDICRKDEAGVNRSDMVAAIKEWRKAKKESTATQGGQDGATSGTTASEQPPTNGTGEQGDGSTTPRDSNNNPGAGEAKKRTQQLTVKQFKEAVEEVAKHPGCPANVAVVVNAVLGLIEGKVELEQFSRTLASVVLPDSGDPTNETLGDYTKPEGGESGNDPTA